MPTAKRRFLSWAALIAAAAAPALSQAPQWETAANHAGDPQYVQLPYEVVFVATRIVETTDPAICSGLPLGQFENGIDVLAATKPSPGNSLWVVTRTGEVKKLFPLPVHQPLIHTPPGLLDKGSVVEPNVSEDGTRIIFSYFHDATNNIPSNQGSMSKVGADLYAMDMSALLADPSVDPATLPVQRLTFRVVDPVTGAQIDSDKNKNAMNPTWVSVGNNGWGTVYMHGTEMRTADGLKLVYVSGEKRLTNSNDTSPHSNYNLNLNIADINADGSLGATRQFQYYTTTSVLSPTPLPDGVAVSYQATTGDGRNWQIQRIDSVGRWAPLIGYGSNPDLFHLGAYCVATQADSHGNPPGNYFVATRYYNANNNGYGSLWKINLADTGINTYDDYSSWGVKPKQKNARRISLFMADGDEPALTSGGQFYGKATSPRCGRPDELFFSHSPTSANSRKCASDGKGIYHAHIVFRSGFEDFNPLATWTPASNDGLRILVKDSNLFYTLAWPVPVLSWQQRTGNAQQAFANSVIDPRSPITPGLPFAQLGTSSIYNTDRRTYDCWLGGGGGGQAYNPNLLINNQKDQITGNFDGVTKVLQTGGVPDFCKPLAKEDVLGVQINITSNNINHDCCNIGYETDGNTKQETVRQLGVYDVRGQNDGSFKAMIPAHVPFEIHLLDIRYGMRLVDVRSWHSLYPRETRTNCGGCHQHVEGMGIPFAGTVAAGQLPLDMVSQTQTVDYDGSCNPIVTISAHATESMPEWKQDIWPGIQANCSSCHTSGGTGAAVFVFDVANEQTAYNELRNKNYADMISGALGSPAFWAARGERTDGRNNALYFGTLPPASPANKPPYHFTSVHATNPGLCAQNDPVKAAWVHKLGQWIDNHMPRDGTGNFPVDKDRYHPTVDGALYDSLCAGTKLRVGYWDDSGFLQQVQVFKNGVSIGGPWGPNLPNGFQNLTGLTIANTDVIKVLAQDADGNRQWYEKRGKQLKDECKAKIQVADPLP
ncbi:MAG TPA: hypothetical protein VGX68_16410 [Thermoanaerobaculia bacterium]|jgi:hypothetical protein|nr:hypothetical protein [Thermoanaerobaculia bacterium]